MPQEDFLLVCLGGDCSCRRKMNIDSTIQKRFDLATRLLDTHQHHRLLDMPLWHWLQLDHLHIPVAWLDRTLREVLRLRLVEIASTRGIGAKKLEKLVLAVDRARIAIAQDDSAGLGDTNRSTGDHASESIEFPYRVACDAHFLGAKHACLRGLDERGWRCVAQIVRHHGLEDFMLGRFAPSLCELDRALWDVKIATFTRRPLSELERLQSYGSVRLRQSICQVLSIAFVLNALPICDDMRLSLLAGPIAEANRWLAQLLPPERQELPEMQSIREGFLRPLLMQVENDGNARLSKVAHRRIGDGVQPATLREIGTEFGVTPDRIRTLSEQAAFILYVRWHEGDYLLQAACAELSDRGDVTAQGQLLKRIHDVLFGKRKSLFGASGSGLVYE